MQNKRGLSEVVTNVLMIALVVIAVAAIAYFLIPMITRGGEKAQQTEACLSISLEVSSCSKTADNVVVKRNPGEADIKEVKVIFEKDDGSTEVVTISDYPEQLGTRVYANDKDYSIDFTPKSVSVAAGIANSKGAVGYCTPTQPVACN